MKKTLLLFSASLYFVTQFANAQAGAFDTSFGINGMAKVLPGNLWNINLQPDGKIVSVGQLAVGTGPDRFIVTRCLADGSPDTDFGTNGQKATLVGAKSGAFGGIVQPDGKIIAVGYTSTTTDNFGDFDIIAARYTTTGDLDTTFGVNGIFSFPREGGDGANAVDLQADGKIVIAGKAGGNVIIIRLMPNGSLDTSFNQTGYVITNTAGYGEMFAVKVLTDGSILAAGRNGNDAIVYKYNSDGSAFQGFGTAGKVTVPNMTGITLIYNFAVISNDDFIVVGGNMGTSKYNSFMAKFTAQGVLVTGFGTSGLLIEDGGAGISSQARDIAVSNNKIIVGHGYGPASNYDFKVSRYDLNGVPDVTFGTNGNVIFNLGSANIHDYLKEVKVQPDGKIVIGGRGFNGGFTLVRLLQEEQELGLGAVALNKNNIKVFPNPITQNSKLEFTLNSDVAVTVDLFDVKGAFVKTLLKDKRVIAGTTATDVQLPELEHGVYFLKITGNGISKTLKVIK